MARIKSKNTKPEIYIRKLLSILEPKNFIGFAPEQTEKFIDIEIKPILEKYKNLLGMDSELKV